MSDRPVAAEITSGEVVAVGGPTGAGKTTIVDLLLRFDDPTSGAIRTVLTVQYAFRSDHGVFGDIPRVATVTV